MNSSYEDTARRSFLRMDRKGKIHRVEDLKETSFNDLKWTHWN